MRTVDDLVTWLRAQLDEDERMAREATGGPWEVGPTFGGRDNRVYVKPEGFGIDTVGTCIIAGQVANMPEYRANAEYIARHNPARVLAEVDAKRRILDRHASYDFPADLEDGPGAYSWTGRCDHCHEPWPCPDLRDVAAPLADRPGYREDWRP